MIALVRFRDINYRLSATPYPRLNGYTKIDIEYLSFSPQKVMSLGTLVGALGPDIDRMIAKVFGTLPFKVRSNYLPDHFIDHTIRSVQHNISCVKVADKFLNVVLLGSVEVQRGSYRFLVLEKTF